MQTFLQKWLHFNDARDEEGILLDEMKIGPAYSGFTNVFLPVFPEFGLCNR